jgi:uncharacterized protein
VKVVEVDAARKRIALTMRLRDETPRPNPADAPRRAPAPKPAQKPAPQANTGGAFAEAFARAQKNRPR